MTLHTNRDGETIELNNGNADLVVGTTRCAQVAAGYRPLNRSAQGPSFDCPLIAVRNVPIHCAQRPHPISRVAARASR